MKIFKRKTTLLVGLALVLFALPGALFGGGVAAQPDDAVTVVDRLAAEGVPVIDSSAVEGQVAVTLQSASATDVGTPDDPLFVSRVERELVLAKSRGVEVKDLQLTVLNSQGKLLSTSQIPVEQTVDLSWLQPSVLSDTAAEQSIREQIEKKAPLAGVSLDTLLVGSEKDGSRVLTLSLSAKDQDTANQSWAGLMIKLYGVVNETNTTQKAQISLVRVDLVDEAGKPLFRYVYDVQRGNQSWWQAPGMTTDWFERP